MNVFLNENQKMRDALQSIKHNYANSSNKDINKNANENINNLIENVDSLYLTDFSILDHYDLENNIRETALNDFDTEDIEINLSADVKEQVQDLEDNWIPIVIMKSSSFSTTDYAFNIESSEIASIESLTNKIQNLSFQITYCSDQGKTGVSSEYGLYYEKEPEYTTECVYINVDLKDCWDKYLAMNPSFTLIREEKE